LEDRVSDESVSYDLDISQEGEFVMVSDQSKFWFGVALGTLSGVLISQKVFNRRRMPNAKTWQQLLSKKTGHIEAATLIARVQQRYIALIDQGASFENKALQLHHDEVILPGLALYQTLRADGLMQETALTEVDALFEAHYSTGPIEFMRRNHLLAFMPGGFSTFKRLVRAIMRQGFPSPAWEMEYIPEDEQRFGFDFHRCFYLDMLTYYGAPELTASFCKVDDISMTALPNDICWKRTSTLGMGATHCDFRWEYISVEGLG
jgi:hypothetical protein